MEVCMRRILGAVSTVMAGFVVLASAGCRPAPPNAPTVPAPPATSAGESASRDFGAPATSNPAEPAPRLAVITTSPERGTIGTPFTIQAEGLPPGRDVELQWATWSGRYATKASAETVEYLERQ